MRLIFDGDAKKVLAEPPAPVVRLGGTLHGPDTDTVIAPEMCNCLHGRIRDAETGETEETWVVWRWWSARPGEEQRRGTKWPKEVSNDP